MSGNQAGYVLRSLIDVAPMPMWLIASDGSVALVNEAATTVMGYSSEGQIIGTSSHDSLHSRRSDGSPYPSHQCPIVNSPGRDSHSHVEDFIDRNGHAFRVLWKLKQLHGSDHKLLTFTPTRHQLQVDGGNRELPGLQFGELMEYITSHCEDPSFNPGRLADRAGMSLRTLQSLFAHEGTSPAREIRQARLRVASRLLREEAGVSEAAFLSGFSDVGTFSRAYRREYGVSPGSTKREKSSLLMAGSHQ